MNTNKRPLKEIGNSNDGDGDDGNGSNVQNETGGTANKKLKETVTVDEKAALSSTMESENREQKIINLENAANGGDAEALFDLGIIYRRGKDVEKSMEKSLEYLEKAADGGSRRAMEELGFMYFCWGGVDTDINKALKYYKNAVDLGSVRSMLGLGNIYYQEQKKIKRKEGKEGKELEDTSEDSVEVEKVGVNVYNYKKAFKCFQKACDHGSAEGASYVGRMYLKGRGVEKDIEKAIEFYNLANTRGYKDALVSLGDIHLDFFEDHKKALEFYQIAVDEGLSRGMNRIGWMYYRGIGVKKNVGKAIEVYQKEFDHSASYNSQKLLLNFYMDERKQKYYDPQKAFTFLFERLEDSIEYTKGESIIKPFDEEEIEDEEKYQSSIKKRLGELWSCGHMGWKHDYHCWWIYTEEETKFVITMLLISKFRNSIDPQRYKGVLIKGLVMTYIKYYFEILRNRRSSKQIPL